MRQRLMNLTAAPGITAVAIHRPNGARLWKGFFNDGRILLTPVMAPGLYYGFEFVLKEAYGLV
jgi:hypothetical protein